MAYTKTIWTEATGITTARLNNLETQYDKAIAEATSMINNAKPVIGSYVGDDSNSLKVNLGFRPRFVIIAAATPEDAVNLVLGIAFDTEYQIALTWEDARMGNVAEFTSTGFEPTRSFSVLGVTYFYIAFR